MKSKSNRSLIISIIVILCVSLSPNVLARDNAVNQSISEAMNTGTANAFEGVRFYFGEQPHPAIKKSMGTFSSRRTTNAFNKSDKQACEWAFLSAIKTFYERAIREGGNAVVNIVSITTGREYSSAEEYVCRAGNVLAKVYISGDIVSI